jgi:hypothetical protein
MTTLVELGWMEAPWMVGEWMSPIINASTGMQADVLDRNVKGMQVEAVSRVDDANGMQAVGQILDASGAFGFQVNEVHHVHKSCLGWMEGPWMSDPWMTGTFCVALGMQVVGSGFKALGMQVNSRLYNTNNLRILCDFLSRGLTGSNWSATSTETGDFSPNNLNTDLVEQVWRSTSTVTQILTCDAQAGILVDTVGMINHNLSSAGQVTLQASDSAIFSTIDLDIDLQFTSENIYWLSPELPLVSFRYWRFIIDDVTNPDGFIQVGSIVFGSSEIFAGECFVDDVDFGFVDYTDKVSTEGFTNISNSRTIKKVLGLQFRFLNSFEGNFKIMRSLFTTFRTTHKCLWIPTPDATDQSVTGRFSVFSKLVSIPRERHKSPSNDLDYASFSVDLDEAE